jgi:hypothetical protein
MSDFAEREKAFENKFKMDEELRFKINNRRAKLLGLWVAEFLGYKGAAADDYARTVVEADLAAPGHEDLIAKIEMDVQSKGVTLSRVEIEKEMENLIEVARQQIMEKAS